jgi:hypothetical protein
MDNRPVASLTPTLLARKGGARPAMRPQVAPLRQFDNNAARQLDDLGWNDMGNDADDTDSRPEQRSAEIVELNPGLELPAARHPEVLRQRAEMAERISQKSAPKPAQRPPAPRRSVLNDGRRAAFTLRLDAERHLKLRLACVTSNRSAQQLVLEALDQLIGDMPEVVELAAKVRKQRR